MFAKLYRTNQPVRIITALVFALLAFFYSLHSAAQPARANPAAATANEWDLTTPTGWNTVSNLTAQQLTDFLTSNNERIVDLEVKPGAEVLFSAATVKNLGEYAKTSWWYPDLNLGQVMLLLTSNQARLIDVEVYVTDDPVGEGEAIHYAVVMVSNTGAEQKNWTWMPEVDADGISQYLSSNNYRIIDLEAFDSNNSRVYAAILISNTGEDFSNWGYLLNVTWPEIEPHLATGRLLDIVHEGEDRFSAVIENCPCSGWWAYFGTSLGDITARAAQEGARIFDLEIYTDESVFPPLTMYAGIMLDNLDSETRRIANILASVPEVREYGLYLKEVGGPELAILQADFVHEPLSSIKVLPHFYAMKQVQETGGRVNLGTPIQEYVETGQPGENCYLPYNPPSFLPLGDMLSDMMVPSSNPAWAATVNHFGKEEIQDYVTNVLQMAQTEIRRVGCSDLYNRWTLRDAGKLYESVANGSQLHGGARIDFYNIMAQKWVDVDMLIDEEAPLGMSHNDRNLYKSLVQVPHKDGGWAMPAGGEIQEESARTRIGVLRLPVCAGPFRVTRSYTYGVFISAARNVEADVDAASLEAATELMRAVVQDSLSQWDDCAPIDLGSIDGLGGLLQSDDGLLSVSAPQGAVAEPVNLFYTDQIGPYPPLPLTLAGLFRFSLNAVNANGGAVTTFNAPLTLEVSYQDADVVQAGGNEEGLSLAFYDERLERWVLLASTVDPINNRVTAPVGHFTNFALAASVETFSTYVPLLSR